MCGRYELKYTTKYESRFDVDPWPDLQDRYNVPPGTSVPLVIKMDGVREAVFAKWGLIPPWTKEGQNPKFKPINCKSETVQAKFAGPFQRHRCLMPASAFFEPDKSQKPSQPWLFRLRSQEPFGMGAVAWEWEGQLTCAIITTQANELVGRVHGRMPVLVAQEDEEAWLADWQDSDEQREELMATMAPYPLGEMEAFPVSKELWKGRSDPGVVDAIDLDD